MNITNNKYNVALFFTILYLSNKKRKLLNFFVFSNFCSTQNFEVIRVWTRQHTKLCGTPTRKIFTKKLISLKNIFSINLPKLLFLLSIVFRCDFSQSSPNIYDKFFSKAQAIEQSLIPDSTKSHLLLFITHQPIYISTNGLIFFPFIRFHLQIAWLLFKSSPTLTWLPVQMRHTRMVLEEK